MRLLFALCIFLGSIGVCAAQTATVASATRPAWTNSNGNCGLGIVGFGIVDVTAHASGGHVTVTYEVPPSGGEIKRSIQLIVIKSEDFPRGGGVVPQDWFVSWAKSGAGESSIQVNFPASTNGRYFILYGPYEALITSYPTAGNEDSEIVVSVQDGEAKWLDPDVGEVVVAKAGPPIWVYVRKFHRIDLMDDLGFKDLGDGVPEVQFAQNADTFNTTPECTTQ